MSNTNKWRWLFLGGNRTAYHQILSLFQKAYETKGRPAGWAMFEHTDASTGRVAAVSITPAAAANLDSFPAEWKEISKPHPASIVWAAGDDRLEPVIAAM